MRVINYFASLFCILVAASLLLTHQEVSAFFHFDQEAFGVPTKTTLPDGRLHYKYNEVKNAAFPTKGFGAKLPSAENLPSHLPKPEFSFRAEVVMKPHWQIFDVSEHTDTSKLVCHDAGDINLRMSLFGISAELSLALKTAPQNVILTADANQAKCHSFPIFRRVINVHDFTSKNNGEVLLITHRANYEYLFDEADVHLEASHPNLTHFHGDSVQGFTEGALHFDHDASDFGATDFESAASTGTYGASVVPRSKNILLQKKDAVNAKKMSDYIQPNTQADDESEDEEDLSIAAGVSSSALAQRAEKRSAKKLGWFKKVKKSFKKAVKKVKKAVKKVVKKVKRNIKTISRGISAGASNLIRNIGRGFMSGFRAVANVFQINLNINKNKVIPFGLKKGIKLGVVSLSAKVSFTTTLYFKLRVSRNKLEQVHFSVLGQLRADGAAGANIAKRMETEAQTQLFEIKGPRISFMISVVPVWIDTSLPVSIGFTLDFDFRASFQAGFGLSASARIGGEYNRGKGFTPIATRSFGTTKYLKYTAQIDANVYVYVQPALRFALYSFVANYAMVQFGLDNHIFNPSSTRYCDLNINSNWKINIIGSLAIEIAIGSIDIYEYNFGTVKVYTKSWPAFKSCLRFGNIARSILRYGSAVNAVAGAEEESIESVEAPAPLSIASSSSSSSSRSALALNGNDMSNEDTQSPEAESSGREWTTEIDCPIKAAANGSQYYDNLIDIQVNGNFLDNLTILYVSVSRNITWTDGNTSLVSQGQFFFFENNFSLGLKERAWYVSADDEGFQELGLDFDTVQNMEGFATGSDSFLPLNLSYIDISISNTSIDDMTVSSPFFCSNNAKTTTLPTTATEPEDPPADSEMAAQLKSLDQKVGEAFLRLVTDSIIIMLILAVFEVLFAWQSPRILGKYFPTTSSKPSGREKVAVISTIILCTFCFIIFLSGMTRNWAQVVGIKVETNYSSSVRPSAFSPPPPAEGTPSPSQPRSALLKASGLEADIWTFAGAEIKHGKCPQYAPCYPAKICMDLCVTQTSSWAKARWPYCPGDLDVNQAPSTESCYNEASDVYSHVTFLCLFFLAIVPPVFYFATVYRRFILSHASLMMVGLNMSLLWHRVDSFMSETVSANFDPAASMIVPYRLFFDSDSQWLMRMGAILLFVLIGLYFLYIVFECYCTSKDELEKRHFHQSFEEKNAMSELADVEAMASVTGEDNKTAEESASKEQPFLL